MVIAFSVFLTAILNHACSVGRGRSLPYYGYPRRRPESELRERKTREIPGVRLGLPVAS